MQHGNNVHEQDNMQTGGNRMNVVRAEISRLREKVISLDRLAMYDAGMAETDLRNTLVELNILVRADYRNSFPNSEV